MSRGPRKKLEDFVVTPPGHDGLTPTKEHEVSTIEAPTTAPAEELSNVVNITSDQSAESIGKAVALGLALDRLKALQSSIEDEIKLTSDALLTELGKGGSVRVRQGDEVVTFTRSDPDKVTIHEDELKAGVSARKWVHFSKRVADREKIEAGITLGRIAPALAAKVRTVAPGTPRVVITRKKS